MTHTPHTPTHTAMRQSPLAGPTEGLLGFAGVLLVVAGVWHALTGIAALLNDNLYLSTPDYVYALDLTGWGWGHLVLGALVVLAGAGVLMGTTWGRILGIAVVVLSLVANFLFLPRYPMWSLALIAVDLAVLWALATRLVSRDEP
ncbi:DUF7144 family membrane protein [Amycolatopsis magusensis]|uniref:DUF7144 family membrane protein n=1 Tax=Amycolatopsis magusensis TaxID=882444 RepID=UPI0024A98340|nr:hypothetical protein [Amycolatopsis magusensis]MDI5978143.1 hypothetical protein [Amycolatopsis magusensis]